MYKKILFIIFILISFVPVIHAKDEYSCFYDFSYKTGLFEWFTTDASLEFKINVKDKTISYSKSFFNSKSVYFMDYYIDDKYTEEYIVDSLDGGCVKNIVIGTMAYSDVFGYAIFFEESNFYILEESIMGYVLPEKFVTENKILGAITKYAIGTYNENKSTGETKEADFGCDYYDDTIEKLRQLNCNNEENKCNKLELQQFKNDIISLKNFCSSVTRHANYGLSYCLPPCLSLSSDPIFSNFATNSSACGLSGKLIIWISNIVRWGKYIVPVVVIVLGILDFIKAIASEKDDEMKKAQGRFTKRLISAALIFIVPFIIEFVLNKMGFDANGCGIIDL